MNLIYFNGACGTCTAWCWQGGRNCPLLSPAVRASAAFPPSLSLSSPKGPNHMNKSMVTLFSIQAMTLGLLFSRQQPPSDALSLLALHLSARLQVAHGNTEKVRSPARHGLIFMLMMTVAVYFLNKCLIYSAMAECTAKNRPQEISFTARIAEFLAWVCIAVNFFYN